MKFICLKDKEHKFEVEKPKDIEGNWHWNGVVHCVYCGSTELQEDFIPSSMSKGPDLVKARRENREATADARRRAGEAQTAEDKRDPTITLAPIQGASAFGRAAPVKVKQSLLDSIAAKTPDGAYKE